MELVLEAQAKVNLGLWITGRRPDGYHELVTVMQPLSLADELAVRLRPEGHGLSLTCDDPALAGDGNLVLKAARAYYEAVGREPAAEFHLTKRIPVAAGLGGGSSDAAAALLGLNSLHGGALPARRLVELAAGLGADVPFFLGCVTSVCRGVGEQVTPWPEFPLLHYVLVNPGFAVSAAWAYAQWDLAWTNMHDCHRISGLNACPKDRGVSLFNHLEQVVVEAHPAIAGIKAALLEAGALGAVMSGSGPTVFGLFCDQESAAKGAAQLASGSHWWVCACRGVHA